MKEMRILDNLNQVDDKFISEAAPRYALVKRSGWIKWVAVAASIVLASALGIDLLRQSSHPYTATLSNGSKITFVKSEISTSNLDIAVVGVRDLSETEASAVFGNLAVDADVGFEEDTNEFIYLEGTLDGFKIVVTRSDVTTDTVIDGVESVSNVNGVSVSAGYFLTKVNSKGTRTAIFYGSFDVDNYTVYLENSGKEGQSNGLCNALAQELQKLIETANFDFGQIKYK